MQWRVYRAAPQYEVSEHGDVRNRKTLTRLKGYINCDGYIVYRVLCEDGRKREKPCHCIVAETYLGPCPGDGFQVAHADGSRLNNHPSNLRWSRPKENHQDRRVHGTGPVGERNPKAKITERDVRSIRLEYRKIKARNSGRRVEELEEKYGLHRETILNIAMGRSWKHVSM
ncbi:MAG: HNH endonuclease [Pseudomonadota bacterium]